MGSDVGDPDEKPAHQVNLGAFYMDVYEVTNAMYKDCVTAGVCDPPHSVRSAEREAYYDAPEFENYPVIFVSWDQAKIYCEWRGARLPTEAEWEKAARGTDGRIYPWGEGLDCSKANYSSCAGDTTAVGSHDGTASPFGIFDLLGNVWEWVSDWYSESYYLNSIPNDPIGPTTGSARVSRGGSFINPGSRVSVTNRNWYPQSNFTNNMGFRCVRDYQ